jgi:hypothetical protein
VASILLGVVAVVASLILFSYLVVFNGGFGDSLSLVLYGLILLGFVPWLSAKLRRRG